MKTALVTIFIFVSIFACLFQSVAVGTLLIDNGQIRAEATRMATAHATQQAYQTERQFYIGMYALCLQSFEGYGVPASEVQEKCNLYVANQRRAGAFSAPVEGYTP